MNDEMFDKLMARDKEYHNKPFLSQDGGGMNCYHMPVESLLEAVDAFRTLFLHAPQIHVSGTDLIQNQGGKIRFERLIDALVVSVRIKAPYVGVYDEDNHIVFVKPEKGAWDEVELSVPPWKD